jgi:hypothetical protein
VECAAGALLLAVAASTARYQKYAVTPARTACGDEPGGSLTSDPHVCG